MENQKSQVGESEETPNLKLAVGSLPCVDLSRTKHGFHEVVRLFQAGKLGSTELPENQYE